MKHRLLPIVRWLSFLLLGFVIIFFMIDYFQEPVSLKEYRETLHQASFIQLSKGLTRYELNLMDTTHLVVFIHGGGIMGYDIFRDNIDALNRAGFSTLAYDQYGRGYSDKPNISYTSDELYTQLLELLQALNLQKNRISLISHSFGSVIAWRYYKDHPTHINRCIYISPSLFNKNEPLPILRVPLLNRILMTFYWRPLFYAKQRKEFVLEESYGDYIRSIDHFSSFSGFKRIYLSSWVHIMSEGIDIQKLPEEELPLLKRSYYIFGDSDPFFRAIYREKILRFAEPDRFFLVTNSGHMPNFEQRKIVDGILLEYLK